MTIIINSSHDNIQTYITCTDDIALESTVDIQDLPIGMLTTVGSNSSSDLSMICSGDNGNLFIGVWGSEASKGFPNSWIAVNRDDLEDTNSHYAKYNITVSRNKEFVITITDNYKTSTFGTLYIILVILLLLIGGGIAILHFGRLTYTPLALRIG